MKRTEFTGTFLAFGAFVALAGCRQAAVSPAPAPNSLAVSSAKPGMGSAAKPNSAAEAGATGENSVAPTAAPASADMFAVTAGAVPPLVEARDVYAANRPNNLSPFMRKVLNRVYVPNSGSNTVDVIDANTYRIVDHFAVGKLPQHVTPAWDMKTLWISNDLGNSLTPVDPVTGVHGKPVSVEDPYNLYFTPDGRYAIVVCERFERLDFRDAHTMKLVHSLHLPGKGVDHMDFSRDGKYLIASCEFSGDVVKVDVEHQKAMGSLKLKTGGMPQDVKLSPDGSVFYVADMMSNGVWLVDGDKLQKIGFVTTGGGAHGLYPSRDSKTLYVSNRHEGSITVLSFATRKPIAKWRIPHGGSPDMGNVSSDGKTLWLSGRYNSEVYAFDTSNGKLRARIHVGKGPHGLCVYPQPGRYSLGHTGVFR